MKTPRAICVAAGLMLASVAGCPARREPRGFTIAPGAGSPTGRRGRAWSFAGRGQEAVRRAVLPLSWRTGREILVDRTSAQPAEAHARTASAERQGPPARLYGRAALGGAALHREFPQPGVAGANIQLKDSFAPRCAESCHPWTPRSDHPQSLSLPSGVQRPEPSRRRRPPCFLSASFGQRSIERSPTLTARGWKRGSYREVDKAGSDSQDGVPHDGRPGGLVLVGRTASRRAAHCKNTVLGIRSATYTPVR